ncbi:Uncharacterized protein dnm_030080 [Desulfonema magnum]|uniref:Uncharacterized protein n=1 Tax=Desulfonema magnum TaxID=45655 RepID=A0A975GMK0_9BACT|nr:Uncharacterized protein dnm_030080 [Desulfonema magnum]
MIVSPIQKLKMFSKFETERILFLMEKFLTLWFFLLIFLI